jgi:hypothetical protein
MCLCVRHCGKLSNSHHIGEPLSFTVPKVYHTIMGLSTPKFRCNTSKKFRRKNGGCTIPPKRFPFFFKLGLFQCRVQRSARLLPPLPLGLAA